MPLPAVPGSFTFLLSYCSTEHACTLTCLPPLTLTIQVHHGTNLDYTPTMTSSDIERITSGSKFQFAAWYTYTSMIWSMKASMLFFYRRLTFNSLQQRLVQWIALSLLVTYLINILTISLSCRPFVQNWAAPTTCSPTPTLLTISSLNIAMSLAILSIPIPLLWKLQVPRKQKIAIGLFLTTGVVVILAAGVRIGAGLGLAQTTVNLDVWGVREALVGILFKNLPVLRQFFRGNFWRGEGSSSAGTGAARRAYASERSVFRTKTDEAVDKELEGGKGRGFGNKGEVHVQVEVFMGSEDRGGDVEMGNSARAGRL
ncbi:hypothetical protein BDZ85DRAFT_204208 [Elsinoe ampelina]|uniref:Rhodopsin domain-containing protein n=1 Tax=Elsinoe ampelina TaxID=302913 RepID=A0A6A6G448_9PEZI|nr:hypothetical protein BDZ85DRAFT_204208 [Elsinoe ampelina]